MSVFAKKASLYGLKSQLDRQSAKLIEVVETMKEIKAENLNLKKELIDAGIIPSASAEDSDSKDSFGPRKTLIEIVEQIQSDVETLQANLLANAVNNNKTGEIRVIQKKEKVSKSLVTEYDESNDEGGEELATTDLERNVVPIRSRTIAEERDWIQERFLRLSLQQTVPDDGDSLVGTTIDAISSGIRLSELVGASCSIKLANYLTTPLMGPREFIWRGRKINAPPRINPRSCEAITFDGSQSQCTFLCSFALDPAICFTLYCETYEEGLFRFGIGFTPENAPIDSTLYRSLRQKTCMPDICMMVRDWSEDELEFFINQGLYFARAFMTPGPRSILTVEILKDTEEEEKPASTTDAKVENSAAEAVKKSFTLKNPRQSKCVPSNLGPISCIVEIENELYVSLKNARQFIRKSKHNSFMPSKILAFKSETFFVSDEKTVEAMFSFEIDTTDLGLQFSLKVLDTKNLFSVAFVPLPALTNDSTFSASMDEEQWETHSYRKFASAQDGEQTIQTRNLKAVVSMTNEKKSVLKIRILSV